MSLLRKNRTFFPVLANDLFGPDWFGGIENATTNLPAVNIIEKEKGFELELAVPGFKKDDFTIEVDKDVLTISNEVKSDNETSREGYTRKEFTYSSFKRSFAVPETVNASKIDASYESGILRLTLPKKEEALPEPKRLIEIA